MDNQILVPMIAGSVEHWMYKLAGNNSGSSFNAQGQVLGLWLLMNPLEENTADKLYEKTGISRSYLVAEYHNVLGWDEYNSLDETSIHFGLRCEF